MRRQLKVLGILTILTVLMAGCFKIGSFKFSKMGVRNGEKTTLELGMYSYGEEGNRDYPFIVVILPASDTDPEGGTALYKVVKPKVFDATGKVGGPYNMVQDASLRQFMIDEDPLGCEEIAGGQVLLFRTEARINDQGQLTRKVLTKIGLKVTDSDDPYAGTNVQVQVIAGGWDDDLSDPGGAGVPEFDEVACNSDINTSFVVKADPDAPPKTFRQTVRKAARNG